MLNNRFVSFLRYCTFQDLGVSLKRNIICNWSTTMLSALLTKYDLPKINFSHFIQNFYCKRYTYELHMFISIKRKSKSKEKY